MTRIPTELRAQVIRRVYADADRIRWNTQSPNVRSSQYDRWVSDPQVGGILSVFIELGRVRIWLKDNPLKHYLNAKHGVGPYAPYADITGPTPSLVASTTLGNGWQVVQGTIRDKPLRFQAGREDAHAAVAYGPSPKFRDLIWSALNDAISPTAPPRSVVAVIDEHEAPTSDSERFRQQRMADRCSIEVKWISFASSANYSPSAES